MSFRKLARAVAGAAALVSIATCSEVTGPGKGPGVRVSIAPTFSAAATFAKALYAAAGIEFDRVRVVIVRGETEVLKDTTVAYSPASAELSLPLLITASPGEIVQVTLEYRSADIVMYSGTSSVAAVAVGSPAATPTPVVIIPVGPGSTAASVTISPTSGNFPTSAPVTFTAQAFKSDNTPIVGSVFGWTVDDGTIASVNAQGIVQPTSKGGVVKVRATTLNEKFAEASITFVTAPASLAIQSGGNQSAMNSDPLPSAVVVKVRDANGVAVPGATVNFAVVAGGGSLAVVNGVSDAAGLVSVNWTLGATVGIQSITATAVALPNAPITINATATERPVKSLAFGQQPTKSVMGASIAPAVTVQALDDKNHVMAGYTGAVTIGFNANPGSATLGGTLTVNAVAGVATFANLTVGAAGTGYTLKATATGLTQATSSAFDVDQVPSGLSISAGGSQTAAVKSVLSQIVLKVADANGVGVQGVTVTFAVATGGGSIVVNNGVTDASGLARATWTLGTLVGQQSITATSGTLAGSPLTITATGTALPAVALTFVQQPTAAITNAAIIPNVTIKAVDADGNTVTSFTGNVVVALQTPGGATLGGTTSVAAVAGVATFSNLTVNVAGSYKLTATSAPVSAALSSTFVISPPPAVALVFLVHPPPTVLVDSVIKPAIQVKIVDANGAIVTSATNAITVSLHGTPNAALHTLNPTVNAVNGIATFSDLSVVPVVIGLQLDATASGLTTAVSSSFNVIEPPPVARLWNGSISSRWTDAGNWTPSGVPAVIDSVTVVSAPHIAVIDSASAANAILIQVGGTLRVTSGPTNYVYTSKIYNKGTLRLSHAYMNSSIENQGTVVVDSIGITPSLMNIGAGSKLQLTSLTNPGAFFTTGTLINEGLIEMTDVAGQPAYLAANDSIVNKVGGSITSTGGQRDIIGTIRNYGTISFTTGTGIILQPSSEAPSLNAGSFTVAGGGYLYQVFPDSTNVFENTGTISLGSGEWDLIGGHLRSLTGTVTGTDVVRSTQSQLELDFSKFGMAINMDDHSRFAGDSVNVPVGGTLRLSGGDVTQKLTVQGTVLAVNSPFGFSFFNGGATVRSGGVLDIRNTSGMQGNFTILAGGKLSINASGQNVELDASNAFTNSGQIELTSGVSAYAAGLNVNGTLTNAVGATISALGGTGGERDLTAILDNKGTVNIAQNSYLNLIAGAATHTNSGTIDIANAGVPGTPDNTNNFSLTIKSSGGPATLSNSGTINIGSNRTLSIYTSSAVSNASTGVIGGKGTIDASLSGATFTNGGKIEPGGAGVVGTMTYKGNFNIGTGTVGIDFQSSLSGDLLQVTGSAAVTGKFVVNKLSGYTWPVIDPARTVVTSASCSGTPTVEPIGFPIGFYITLNANCVQIYPNFGAPPPGDPPTPPFSR